MTEPAGFPEGVSYESLVGKKASFTRSFQINLRKFFPPDDDYATCMARLCILREDLTLEIHGIMGGPYQFIDGNGVIWRHNYFFRNSARTLQEIASALQTLNCLPEFKGALQRNWKPIHQRRFKEFCKLLASESATITEVRNSIGGHVKHSVMARALKTIDFDRTGFWERASDNDDKIAHTHHPFINELFIAMLQAGDAKDDSPAKDLTEVLRIAKVLASLIHAIPHIDSLFELYVIDRGLLE